MNSQPSSEIGGSEKEQESLDRRLFLRSIGKWSGAAIAAVGFGGAWFAFAPKTNAGIWINRWGPRRGGWINRWGSGRGRWINRWGPGPRGSRWVNRW